MPHYHSLGSIPKKRHTQFRKPNGELYSEELVSTAGFSDIHSLVYHENPPTLVEAIGEPRDVSAPIAAEENLQHRCYKGFDVEPADDYLESRKAILTNSDVEISVAAPRQSPDYFYKNGVADELIFVHEGSGTLKTGYGKIAFSYGDYLHLPRGVIYQLEFDRPDNRLLIIESASPLRFPKRYRNSHGQLMEHAPFCERDIRKPKDLETHDESGQFPIWIKKHGKLYPYTYNTHPFDFIGWDGFFYPYAFSIHEFEPITGRIHQPPPVHQTFEADQFVVCSFCPRLFDYHPDAIPAPYNHSNVDSDEVLYYVDGDFMSRKNVEKGMFTLHPMGIPHGPHPGSVEKSIGATGTEELAVMIDTFRPLKLTTHATRIEIADYYRSWVED
jgi:homogentisate 1,2-dioxygenase